MGGEGGGVLADWIVDVAERCGFCAQTTSVPGVAQRTGSTIYYLEIFPGAPARAAGKEPVLALVPVPGEVDVVIASELMEAGRAIQRGLVTPERTTLIASTHRVYSMTEKTAIDDARVDADKLIEGCDKAARSYVHGDFARLAEETHSVISAVLFGALAGTGALPFPREEFEEAVRRSGVGVDSSLAAFAAGLTAATQTWLSRTVQGEVGELKLRNKVGSRLQKLAARIEHSFPPVSHAILLAGVQRLADYQDERYAADYLDRLENVRDLDTQYGHGSYTLLRETGRYLALWMTFEDAARVADLKIRRTRFERVHLETRTGEAQLLQINEFLHPRVQEIADMMPVALGVWLLKTNWARGLAERLTRHGQIVQTTSLRGYLQLYAIAGLRRWRRKSLRFQEEQKRIGQWLAQIPVLVQEDYGLALEVAEFPRVVKGYGDTHVRGRQNFDAMMEALPRLRRRAGAAAYVKKLRTAALADESGQKLAEALQEVSA